MLKEVSTQVLLLLAAHVCTVAASCSGIGTADEKITPVLTVKGMCANLEFLNTYPYKFEGKTADGRDYFYNDHDWYLYYDSDCNGDQEGFAWPGRWLFVRKKPSTTALNDLDGDRECHSAADAGSYASSPPAQQDWNMYCGIDGWKKLPVTITSTCVCKAGYTGTNCEELTPAASTECSTAGAVGPRWTVSGICNDTAHPYNTVYSNPGTTADGRDYFEAESGPSNRYIYFDSSCDGKPNAPPFWMFDNLKPSTTALSNLDTNTGCTYLGRFFAKTKSPPAIGMWNFGCGGGWKTMPITITPSCKCKLGWTGDDCSATDTDDSACNGNGKLSADVQFEYACVCNNGYTGDRCEVEPMPALKCQSDGAVGHQLVVSGMCARRAQLNTAFMSQGTTADGREFFVTEESIEQDPYVPEQGYKYLYYDANCGGTGVKYAPRWMFDSLPRGQLNTTATMNLDHIHEGETGCTGFGGSIISDLRHTYPEDNKVWRVWCRDGTGQVELAELTIRIVSSCKCKVGYTGDNCDQQATSSVDECNGKGTLQFEGTPSCVCSQGYTGDRCELIATAAASCPSDDFAGQLLTFSGFCEGSRYFLNSAFRSLGFTADGREYFGDGKAYMYFDAQSCESNFAGWRFFLKPPSTTAPRHLNGADNFNGCEGWAGIKTTTKSPPANGLWTAVCDEGGMMGMPITITPSCICKDGTETDGVDCTVVTTFTSTTTTTTSTTTTLLQQSGIECASDSQCISSSCQTHCCSNDGAGCSFCGNIDGSCYTPLAISASWNPATALTKEWNPVYNKDSSLELEGPPLDFLSSTIIDFKGSTSDIRFRLMWNSRVDFTAGEFKTGTPPLAGLVTAGEGADPGLFDVDSTTGVISARPRRNGNYTVFLLAVDDAGTATLRGLPAALDQVIVKQWTFEVVGKPDFVVKSYARVDAATLPPVASGEDPFVTAGKVGSLECVVGTMYHIAPIDAATLVYDFASGGEGAQIRFTIRNPPPGFFIEPSTGEVQGNPQPASADQTFTSTLLAIDPAGQEAVLEEMTFTIIAKPQFVPIFSGERTRFLDTFKGVAEDYVDIIENAEQQSFAPSQSFVVGTSYKIDTFVLSADGTKVSAGSVDDITYTLSADAPDSFCVQARSGDISGTFPTPGEYNFSVLAVDQAGERAVAEQLKFTVLERPVFAARVKGPNRDRTHAGDGYTEPHSGQDYVTGQSYKVAALLLDPQTTTVSDGTFEDISFTLSADAPDTMFVQAKTGTIFGQFDSARKYTFELLAVDKGGQTDVMEKYTFDVADAAQFQLGVNKGQRKEVVGALDYGTDLDFFVDDSYMIAPLQLIQHETTVSSGSFADITYTLSSDAPSTFFSNAATGVIFGQFRKPGRFSFSLLAVDKGGETAVVEEHTFIVSERGTFNVIAFDRVQDDIATEYTDPSETSMYAVGSTYRFAPVTVTAADHVIGELENLQYSLQDAPHGFLINPSTGYIQGSPTQDSRGDHIMKLFAVDESGAAALVDAIDLTIEFADADVEAFGPNGLRCDHGGSAVDEIPFDQAFSCNCNTTLYEGPNCAVLTPVASAAESNGTVSIVAGALAGGMVLLVLIGIAMYKKRLYNIKMQAFDFQAEIARLIDIGEIDDAGDGESGVKIPREIKRSHLTMIQQIGEGAFGEVWKGVLDESSAGGVPGYMVAAKTSKEAKGEGADEMMREATVMAQVSGHPNLVSLIGVVTSGLPLMLLISFCEHGSLLSLLKDRKVKGIPVTFAQRVRFGLDTAKGMQHLTANSFVHRDLAARNVLVDALENCKVADFGLARGIAGARAGPDANEDGEEEEYYRSRTGTFPVRWTSPDAMQTMRFSEATDAWSFGITLIEVFTDGSKPYAGMANAAVISQVQGGYRAEQPASCTNEMYAIMLECWAAKPSDRPTFVQLVTMLQGLPSVSATPEGKTKNKKKKKKSAASPAASFVTAGEGVSNDMYMGIETAAEKTKKKKKKKKTKKNSTKSPAKQKLVAVGAAKSPTAQHAVAVNDTYMSNEPAADDEYMSIARGLVPNPAGVPTADEAYLDVAADAAIVEDANVGVAGGGSGASENPAAAVDTEGDYLSVDTGVVDIEGEDDDGSSNSEMEC